MIRNFGDLEAGQRFGVSIEEVGWRPCIKVVTGNGRYYGVDLGTGDLYELDEKLQVATYE